MPPDFKPEARVVNPDAAPFDGSPLFSMVCPLCKRRTGKLTRHHVVPKGQGGDDVPENLVWVCGDGTRGCHGVLTHRNRDGESGLTFAEVGERLVVYALQVVPEIGWYAARKKHGSFLVDYYAPKLAEAA